LYYKRRITGSHCLDNASEIRTESCACSLSDFECLPGYRRSIDGTCLPKSHYTFSQDCACDANSTLLTKRRGYVKSENSQCRNGIENYLSDTYITRRDLTHPSIFLYGIDSHTKRATVELHTNDFDQNDDEDEDEDLTRNTVWLVDPKYEITSLVFNENDKQIYMAVEHDQLAIIYRTGVSKIGGRGLDPKFGERVKKCSFASLVSSPNLEKIDPPKFSNPEKALAEIFRSGKV
jgi:hypothetical protein